MVDQGSVVNRVGPLVRYSNEVEDYPWTNLRLRYEFRGCGTDLHLWQKDDFPIGHLAGYVREWIGLDATQHAIEAIK